MNGFHVNAVGWVLVFNARALSPQDAHELSGLWSALLRAYAEDKRMTPAFLRLMQPRTIPLSKTSLGAFADLVDRMVVLHPECFGWPALRGRRNHWALEAVLCLVLGTLAATWLPTAVPGVREAVVALFLMGCGLLVPTVTLWRAASAVKSLGAKQPSECHVRHSLSRRGI